MAWSTQQRGCDQWTSREEGNDAFTGTVGSVSGHYPPRSMACLSKPPVTCIAITYICTSSSHPEAGCELYEVVQRRNGSMGLGGSSSQISRLDPRELGRRPKKVPNAFWRRQKPRGTAPCFAQSTRYETLRRQCRGRDPPRPHS